MAKSEKPEKDPNDPAQMNRFRQIIVAYQRTHEYDKPLPFLLAGAFVLPIIAGVALGLTLGALVSLIILGVMVGLLLAMLLLVQRTKAATYKRYAGQAGSAEVALSMLPKKWISAPAIAATRQLDAVHRTLGPGGLVLIGEGEPGRLRALLTSEVRKHEKVAYGVKVTTIMMGDGKGQIPLDKLTDYIRKLPKVLEPNQVTEIKSRLNALDKIRPQIPIPKGPMPTSPRQARGARQAMRGR